jgi:hypothetical protein
MAPPRNNNNNPTGRGGFLAGQTGNAGGRPAVNSKLQIWFLSRAREAGEIVVEIAHNKQATKSDAIRLQACREILDRGMGRAPQSLSLSLERALDKPLTAMSLEELEAVREQFRALDSAAPALLEHMIEREEQAELPGLGDDSDDDADEAQAAGGAESGQQTMPTTEEFTMVGGGAD